MQQKSFFFFCLISYVKWLSLNKELSWKTIIQLDSKYSEKKLFASLNNMILFFFSQLVSQVYFVINFFFRPC